jgi:hypothetical protein
LQQVAGVVVELAAPTPVVAEHAAGGNVLSTVSDGSMRTI